MPTLQCIIDERTVFEKSIEYKWPKTNLWESQELQEHLELGHKDPIYSYIKEEHPTLTRITELARRIFKRASQ